MWFTGGSRDKRLILRRQHDRAGYAGIRGFYRWGIQGPGLVIDRYQSLPFFIKSAIFLPCELLRIKTRIEQHGSQSMIMTIHANLIREVSFTWVVKLYIHPLDSRE